MTDLAKLKELAEAANASVALKMQGVSFWVSSGGVLGTPQTAIDDFQTQANPSVVLGLLAEIGRLTGFVVHRREQADQYDEALTKIADQRDQLKAECEGLRAALVECSDSLHGEMLQKFGGQLPDDMHPVTRRDYDRDMAEVAGYLAAMGKGERSWARSA